MTSELQRAANRFNAKRSSGPKTASGKARASANSRRHGLAAQRVYDATERCRIALLADRIEASTGGRISNSHAVSIAAAQVDLERARAVEAALLQTIGDVGQAKLESSGRHSALHRLMRVMRYSNRFKTRRDRLLGEAFLAIAQNEPNFEIVNGKSAGTEAATDGVFSQRKFRPSLAQPRGPP